MYRQDIIIWPVFPRTITHSMRKSDAKCLPVCAKSGSGYCFLFSGKSHSLTNLILPAGLALVCCAILFFTQDKRKNHDNPFV